MKNIELFIDATGVTRLQTSGFQGSSCQSASRALEQALGLVTHEERTAEFFAAHETQSQHQVER